MDQSSSKLVLRLERRGMLAWILNTGGGLSKMRGCSGLGYRVIKELERSFEPAGAKAEREGGDGLQIY